MLNNPIIYKFENFTLDEDEGKLFRDDMRIELQPLQFKTLLLLVKNAGNSVTKDQLANDVWGYAASDNSVSGAAGVRKSARPLSPLWPVARPW
jgi:DNA-binding response OmpR family regulator